MHFHAFPLCVICLLGLRLNVADRHRTSIHRTSIHRGQISIEDRHRSSMHRGQTLTVRVRAKLEGRYRASIEDRHRIEHPSRTSVEDRHRSSSCIDLNETCLTTSRSSTRAQMHVSGHRHELKCISSLNETRIFNVSGHRRPPRPLAYPRQKNGPYGLKKWTIRIAPAP